MNPYARAARFLLRIIALSLILIGGLYVAIELSRPLFAFHELGERHIEINKIVVALNALIFLAGVLLFLFSGKLANKIAQRLDE